MPSWVTGTQRFAAPARVGRDPTGKAVVANLAARAATGDVDPLRIAVRAASKAEGASLRAQVMRVLDYGGADVEAIARALDGAWSALPVSGVTGSVTSSQPMWMRSARRYR